MYACAIGDETAACHGDKDIGCEKYDCVQLFRTLGEEVCVCVCVCVCVFVCVCVCVLVHTPHTMIKHTHPHTHSPAQTTTTTHTQDRGIVEHSVFQEQ